MAEYDKKGNCIHHPQIKLRKKKALRGWTVLLNDCPLCVEQKASAAAQNNNNLGGDNKGENIEDEYSQMQNDIIRKLAMADTTDDTPPPESSTQEQAPINNTEEQIGVDPDDYCNVDEIKDVGDIVDTDTNTGDKDEGSSAVVEKGGDNTAEQEPGVCYSSSSTGSGDHSSEVEHNKKDLTKQPPPATPQAPSSDTEETTAANTPSLEKKMSVKDKQAWLTGAFEKKTVTPEAQNYYGSNTSAKRTPRSWEKKQYIPPPVNAGQIYNNTPSKDTDEIEEPKSMSVKERQAWLKSQAFKKSPNSSPNNPRPVISSGSGGIGGSGGKMSVKERQAWLTNSAFKKKDDADSTIQSLKNRNAPDVSQWGDSPLIEKAKEADSSVGGGVESDDILQDRDMEKVTHDVPEDDKGDLQDMPSVQPEKEKDTEPPPEEEDFRTTVEKLVRQGELYKITYSCILQRVIIRSNPPRLFLYSYAH